MHEEGSIGDVVDLDAGHVAGSGDDSVDVIGVSSQDGDVADLRVPLDTHEIDCAEQAACVPDGSCKVSERTRSIVQSSAERRAERS
jgi:hypothetical protein